MPKTCYELYPTCLYKKVVQRFAVVKHVRNIAMERAERSILHGCDTRLLIRICFLH